MPRCLIDQSIERRHEGEFAFPLGVYPVEALNPREGYVVMFEPADGEDEHDRDEADSYTTSTYADDPPYTSDTDDTPPPYGPGDKPQDWWPDRYVFDIQVNANRLGVLVDMALSLMPGRVYPILDVIGEDAYREIDPYMSYELVGTERVIDGIREMRGYLYEDGMVGFGAISDDPFMYLFVDEHKLVTFAVEPDDHGRVVDMLAALGLEPLDDLRSVETVSHEHRSTLVLPGENTQAFSYEEIVEFLRDQWRLRLNIDPMTNLDEHGRDLGVTGWRCIARCQSHDLGTARYAECLLRARCLAEAEEFALDAVEAMDRSTDVSRLCNEPGTLDATQPQSTDSIRQKSAPRADRSPEPAKAAEETGAQWTDAAIVSCDRLTAPQMADAVRDALKPPQSPPATTDDARQPATSHGTPNLGPLARLDFADLRGDDIAMTGVALTRWEAPSADGYTPPASPNQTAEHNQPPSKPPPGPPE
jgi:hypothetical protein